MSKIGLEGGIWALVTENGETIELIDPPEALQKNGIAVEVELDRTRADVTIGMVGDSAGVRSYRLV